MKNLNQTLKAIPFSVHCLSFFLIFTISCKEAKKAEPTEENGTQVAIEEETFEEMDMTFLVVDEHQVDDVPLTTHPSNQPKTADNEDLTDAMESEDMDKAMEANAETADYEVHSTDVLDDALLAMEYEVVEDITVEEAIIPLDETQTLVSYNKKGKYKDSLQVISEADGTIDQIIFTHKKHKDVYDVQAGMTAKEVKKLRKELKHMVKKGKVFLYSDTSNIMYLLDAQNAEGDELMEADIETLTVDAIIWKDKKDKDK